MTPEPEQVFDTFDRPMRDLRLSVTDRCNFRCHYCMPADRYDENYRFMERKEYLTFDEMERLARLFARLGVNKVRLTGGEPLLRKNLHELVARLNTIEGITDLAMITNGYLLLEHAEQLKSAGLDRLTVSLDSLDGDIFEHMNGRGLGMQRVLEGIEHATALGFSPIKINVVLQRYINDDCLPDFVSFARKTGHIVRFIEYMDVGTCNGWAYREVVPTAEVREKIEALFPVIPVDKAYPGEVADRFRFADGAGEIGFISSITNPFCGQCSRARISADGTLYTCLFAEEGTDLKAHIRSGISDEELLEVISSLWRSRDDRYSELRESRNHADRENKLQGAKSFAGSKIEMYHIGG